MTKTYIANPEKIAETHKFHVIDAENVILGRLATVAATLLRGKHKPIFTPFLDTGDHVIVVNAEKIQLSGNKLDQKMSTYHTTYPGGLRQTAYRKMVEEKPEEVIMKAVWGMLPKNRLGRKLMKKLRVYKGPDHKHQAQNPVPYEFK